MTVIFLIIAGFLLLVGVVYGSIGFDLFRGDRKGIERQGCTLLGANGWASVTGNAYIASTSDNSYLEGPRKPVCVTIPKEGYKFVHTPCLIKESSEHYRDVGSDRGMNEKGFSWTRSWVVPAEPEEKHNMSGVDWFLKMGATVATVEEAIEFVKENPKGLGCQGNYIFADARGDLALVEAGYKTLTVVDHFSKNTHGLAARANRWETPEMRKIDISAKENAPYYDTSSYRYDRAMELLDQYSGKIDIEIMKRIVADTKYRESPPNTLHGKSISSHGTKAGTVSAEVFDPANLSFWYTYGWPDGDYKSSNPAIDTENKNTWGAWIPFILPLLEEEGFYTDWKGNITPVGARYLAKLCGEVDARS